MSSRLEGLGCSYYDKWARGWRGLERPGEGMERELVCGQVRDP